ncbi:MAG: OmpA family protein [Spirochaetes bacterium]|nr:OmpA family protein [Spirochaetota bacterium]
MQRNKFLWTVLSIIMFLSFTATAVPAQEEQQEPQKDPVKEKQLEVEALLKQIKENSEKANQLYSELKNEAESLRNQAFQKLDFIKTVIQKEEKNPNVNKGEMVKAKALQSEAQALFKKNEYRKVIETVDKALGHISQVPIVSLSVSPVLFSPDGNGINDVLIIKPNVISQIDVQEWKLTIKKIVSKNEEIVVKVFSDKGDPSKVIKWDGEEGGELIVDSVSSYVVEMEVIDKNAGVGRSGRVQFKTDIYVNKTDRGMVIDVSSIIFDYNKDTLKTEYKDIVKRIYTFLLAYPEYNIIIEGHTDATGPVKSNWELSQKRAKSVVNYLKELGMEEKRIREQGLGESLPRTIIYEKRGLNRRVVFILLKDEDDILNYEETIKKLDLNKEVEMEKEIK